MEFRKLEALKIQGIRPGTGFNRKIRKLREWPGRAEKKIIAKVPKDYQ